MMLYTVIPMAPGSAEFETYLSVLRLSTGRVLLPPLSAVRLTLLEVPKRLAHIILLLYLVQPNLICIIVESLTGWYFWPVHNI